MHNRTDDKIDYIVENIGGINKTLEFQAKQLEEHIKRTELLEERFVPIEDHVKFIQTSLRLLIGLSSCSALLALLYKLLTK